MAKACGKVENLVGRTFHLTHGLYLDIRALSFTHGYGEAYGRFSIHALELALAELERTGPACPDAVPGDEDDAEPVLKNFYIPHSIDDRLRAVSVTWDMPFRESLIRMLALGVRESRRVDGPSLAERMSGRIAMLDAQRAVRAEILGRIDELAAVRGMEANAFLEHLLGLGRAEAAAPGVRSPAREAASPSRLRVSTRKTPSVVQEAIGKGTGPESPGS